LHWVLTPIMASTWSSYVWSAALLAFVQVFMLWSLNGIAQELENPFGSDINDLDTCGYHVSLNERLIFLLGTGGRRVPTLSLHALPLKPGQDQARKSLITCFQEREEQKSKRGLHEHISNESLCEAPESECDLQELSRNTDLQQSELARESSMCDLQVMSGKMDVHHQSELATRDNTCQSSGSEQTMVEWRPVHHETSQHVGMDAHQTPHPYNYISGCTDGTKAIALPSAPKKLHEEQRGSTLAYQPDLPSSSHDDKLEAEAARLKTSYL